MPTLRELFGDSTAVAHPPTFDESIAASPPKKRKRDPLEGTPLVGEEGAAITPVDIATARAINPATAPLVLAAKAAPGTISNALKETGRTAIGASELGAALFRPAMEVQAKVREAEVLEPGRADPYSTLAAKIGAGTRAGIDESVRQIRRAAGLPDAAGAVLAQAPGLVAEGAQKLAGDPGAALTSLANTLYENPIGALTLGSLATRQVARAALPAMARVQAATEAGAMEKAAASGVEMPEVFTEYAPSKLATALQRIRPGVEAAAESPIRAGVEAVKKVVREQRPEVAEAMGFAKGQPDIRELRGLETSAEIARNNRFVNKIVETFDMPDQERDTFARIVQGLDPIPDDASPSLRKAIDWYKSHDIEATNDLIRRGYLTPEDAKIRAYAPLRITRFAAREGGDMKKGYQMEAQLQVRAEREALRDTRTYRKRADKLAQKYRTTADQIEALEREAATTGALKGSAVSRGTFEARLRALDDDIAGLSEEYANLTHGARQVAMEGTPPPGAMTAAVRKSLKSRLVKRQDLADVSDALRDMRFTEAAKRMRSLAGKLKRSLGRAQRIRRDAAGTLGMAAQITRTGSGPAMEKLRRITNEIEAERFFHGKPAPMYFPHIPDETVPQTQRAHVLTDEIKRHLPSSLRRSVGRLFAFDQYEKNPRVVLARHEREMNAWRRNENILNTLQREAGRFNGRLYRKGETLRPDEVMVSFDLPKIVAARNLRFGQTMTEAGALDDGFYEAVKEATRAASDPKIQELIRESKVYVFPRAAIQELINQYTPSPWVVRAFWDRPTDYWRTATLALRPAWIVNNAVGNALFSTLHGVGPEHWRMALADRWIAKTPDELGTGGLSREAAIESVQDLARAGDPALAKNMFAMWQKLEQSPPAIPIARTADALRSFNNYIEDVSRRANFWKAADKQARLAYVKRTGDKFYRSFELSQEYDRLRPDQVRAALREANAFINDYVNGLTWYERATLRRAVPFVSFLKHQIRLQLMLPTDYPGRTATLKALTLMQQDIDDDAKIPTNMKNQGVIRTPNVFQVGNRRLRAYIGTMGANPLIVGGGPSVGGDITADPRELVDLLYSTAHPMIQAGGQYVTRRDQFGRPFTRPDVIEKDGRFYRRDPRTGREMRDGSGRLVETEPPVPSVLESSVRAFPQSRLARAMVNPRATWTGAPFATETKVDERSLTEITRLSAAMSYLGVPVVLVDEETGERIVVQEGRRQPKRTYRAVVREARRRNRREGREEE